VPMPSKDFTVVIAEIQGNSNCDQTNFVCHAKNREYP